jgi:hypothetical protein
MELVLGAEAAEFANCKIRKTPHDPARVSVYDLIRVVAKVDNPRQTYQALRDTFPEVVCEKYNFKFPGKGQRETPVVSARGVVSIINLLPGQTAAAFRLRAADIVVRALGGDESLVAEIRANAAAQANLPHSHPMRLFGQTVEAEKRKRTLEDDDEVYAAKKQQILRQIKQETAGTELTTIKQHAQGSMSILDLLSAGNAPPATMQLLQTIRHNVTARLGSMIESGMQGLLAIEAVPQQQELSINQQAQRWTVQMYANKLGLPAAACTANKLKAVGAAAGKIWAREKLLPTIERLADGSLARVWFELGSNTAQRARFVPEEEPHLFAEARMKYSLAYKGGYEASDRANFDTWTYPAETGAQVLKEAFQRAAASA